MESDARYAWVGAAILALLLLLGAGIWWLGGGEGPAVKRYLVYFQNQSLEGLQVNSDVRMQGIKVGKVVDYVIQPNQAKTVRVLIEVDARTPVLEGVEAVVARNLVTGLAAVSLNNVWKGGGIPLADIPRGEKYPVIDEGVPDMARFAKNLEGLGTAGQEALGRINRLLSDDNQRAFSTTLNHVAGLSGELRQEIGRLGPELAGTLGTARQAVARLESLGAELAPVVRDGGQVVRQAGQRFDSLATEAEATLKTTRTTLHGLDAGLRDLRVQLRASADLGLQDIQNTAQAMRAASESLQVTSRDFADPGRLLFGPDKGELGPGEQ
jgi:phospholipid/cholesterol/gamma-HCH transport system substrate-binding protein